MLVQAVTLLSSTPELLSFYQSLVDVIPTLCERAGLPQGTPLAMFEVRKTTLPRWVPEAFVAWLPGRLL